MQNDEGCCVFNGDAVPVELLGEALVGGRWFEWVHRYLVLNKSTSSAALQIRQRISNVERSFSAHATTTSCFCSRHNSLVKKFFFWATTKKKRRPKEREQCGLVVNVPILLNYAHLPLWCLCVFSFHSQLPQRFFRYQCAEHEGCFLPRGAKANFQQKM